MKVSIKNLNDYLLTELNEFSGLGMSLIVNVFIKPPGSTTFKNILEIPELRGKIGIIDLDIDLQKNLFVTFFDVTWNSLNNFLSRVRQADDKGTIPIKVEYGWSFTGTNIRKKSNIRKEDSNVGNLRRIETNIIQFFTDFTSDGSIIKTESRTNFNGVSATFSGQSRTVNTEKFYFRGNNLQNPITPSRLINNLNKLKLAFLFYSRLHKNIDFKLELQLAERPIFLEPFYWEKGEDVFTFLTRITSDPKIIPNNDKNTDKSGKVIIKNFDLYGIQLRNTSIGKSQTVTFVLSSFLTNRRADVEPFNIYTMLRGQTSRILDFNVDEKWRSDLKANILSTDSKEGKAVKKEVSTKPDADIQDQTSNSNASSIPPSITNEVPTITFTFFNRDKLAQELKSMVLYRNFLTTGIGATLDVIGNPRLRIHDKLLLIILIDHVMSDFISGNIVKDRSIANKRIKTHYLSGIYIVRKVTEKISSGSYVSSLTVFREPTATREFNEDIGNPLIGTKIKKDVSNTKKIEKVSKTYVESNTVLTTNFGLTQSPGL